MYLKTHPLYTYMAKKKLLLISLQQDEAKKIAQVISNETCRKILDYLADKESTETELAEKLNIPLSTTHYNLKQLIKSGLVVAEEYHYSKRGKEINHYKLANQYIIIAPKNVSGIKSKLRSILPVGIITLMGAGLIHVFQKLLSPTINYAQSKGMAAPLTNIANQETMKVVADQAVKVATDEVLVASTSAAGEAAANTAINAIATNTTNTAAQIIPQIPPTQPNYALWFLIGGLTVLILLIIVELIRSIREQREEQ